jgi:hypothetical protein
MRSTKLLAVALLTLGAVTGLAIAAARGGGAANAPSAAERLQNAQARAVPPPQQRSDYVNAGRLWPRLRGALRAMGDRLEKPGKERLTLTGTLMRDGDSAPFVMVSEFPGKLRLEVTGRGAGNTLVFNERARGRGATDARDADLIETLVFDTAEHFFEGQSLGVGTRLLGSRFRADDGATPHYDGPFYDIYQVDETVEAARPPRHRTKLYYVNSDTMLIERVRYEDQGGGATVRVGVELEWQQVGGQRVPRRITRTEGGSPVLTFVVNAATVGQRVEDGLFSASAP